MSEKNTTIKERVLLFAENQEVNKSDFFKKTGLNYSNYTGRSKEGNLNSDALGKILLSYPNVNLEWMIGGEGEMVRNNVVESSNDKLSSLGKQIPLLPVNAHGGYLDEFIAQVASADCETMLSPIADVDFGITVVGDSMEPKYPSGAKVLIKKINEKAFIEWGKVFVLDTVNGVVVKQLKPSVKDGYIQCSSLNENYPPFEIALQDVFGVYKVMMVLSMV